MTKSLEGQYKYIKKLNSIRIKNHKDIVGKIRRKMMTLVKLLQKKCKENI